MLKLNEWFAIDFGLLGRRHPNINHSDIDEMRLLQRKGHVFCVSGFDMAGGTMMVAPEKWTVKIPSECCISLTTLNEISKRIKS